MTARDGQVRTRLTGWSWALASIYLVTACTSGSHAAQAPPRASSSSPSATASSAGDVQVVRVTAGPSLRFTPKTLSAHPGPIRVVLTVAGELPQNLTIPELGLSTGVVQPGKTAEIRAMMPHSGRFTFYSAYHRSQGMKGTILVR